MFAARRLATVIALATVPLLAGATATAAERAVPVIVHGSTAAGAYWWQQGPADCAPMAARVLVGVATGRVVGPEQMDATAARVAGYTSAGTDWSRMPALLDAYGVASHVVNGATLDDMRTTLDTAGPAIVLINAETVWARNPALIATPGTEPDHAVVLERIDDAAHTVTLVDSGAEREETVATPVFLEAWSASGNSAVVLGG